MGRELVARESLLTDIAKGHHVLFAHLNLVLDFVKLGSISERVNDVFLAKVDLAKRVTWLQWFDAGFALPVILIDTIKLWRDVNVQKGLEHTMGADICWGLRVLIHTWAAFVIFDQFLLGHRLALDVGIENLELFERVPTLSITNTVHEFDISFEFVLLGHFTWDLFIALLAHVVRSSSNQLTRLIICEISLFVLHAEIEIESN